MSQPHLHLQADAIYNFDAPDALQGGETMRSVNDHDPLPLLARLQQRYGEKVTIQYFMREPGQIVIDFVRQ